MQESNVQVQPFTPSGLNCEFNCGAEFANPTVAVVNFISGKKEYYFSNELVLVGIRLSF